MYAYGAVCWIDKTKTGRGTHPTELLGFFSSEEEKEAEIRVVAVIRNERKRGEADPWPSRGGR